jgi:glycosyltransferase involved in cell wall biosynthesis
MRILVFNWRDIKNPLTGGAELLIHEHMKRWVKNGHQVTLFCSAFPNSLKKETIAGVEVVRAGNKYTVYLEAFLYYKKYFKGNFDVIVESINTIPFFTPLYAKEKKIIFIYQLCREIWFYEFPLPLAGIGYFLEPLFIRIYKKYQVFAISQSTKQDLIDFGLKEQEIHIIPVGIAFQPLASASEKKDRPTIIYVGRLKKSKRVHHIIRAFSRIKKELPEARLWIVGEGDELYKKRLQELTKKSGLTDVTFWGFVEQEEKLRLMREAWLLVMTSVKEGWGLTVIEANALGTPSVVYDVSGLRDSTKNGYNGLVCLQNTPDSLAETILNLLNDRDLYGKLCSNALEGAKNFNWDSSAEVSLQILKESQ